MTSYRVIHAACTLADVGEDIDSDDWPDIQFQPLIDGKLIAATPQPLRKKGSRNG